MTDERVDSFLSHHGILGQKWGVRRYQNPDGSLTEAGKKRYDRDLEKASKYDERRKDISEKLRTLSDSPDRRIKRGKLESKKLQLESARSKYEVRGAKAIGRRISGRGSLLGVENLPTEKFLDNRAIYKTGKLKSRIARIDKALYKMDQTVANLELKGARIDRRIDKIIDRYSDMPYVDFQNDFEKRKNIAHDDSSGEYLSHHGILGQKWGVRRYQNPDGSLTEAGKKRREKLLKDLDEVGGTPKPEVGGQRSSEKSSEPSLEELRQLTEYARAKNDYDRSMNESLSLKKQYEQLTAKPAPPPPKTIKNRVDDINQLFSAAPLRDVWNKTLNIGESYAKKSLGLDKPKSYKERLDELRNKRAYDIEMKLAPRYYDNDYLDKYFEKAERELKSKDGGKGMSDKDTDKVVDKLLKRLRDEGVI